MFKKCEGCACHYHFEHHSIYNNEDCNYCLNFYLEKLPNQKTFICPCWECVVKPTCPDDYLVRSKCSEFDKLFKELPSYCIKDRCSSSSSLVSSKVSSLSSSCSIPFHKTRRYNPKKFSKIHKQFFNNKYRSLV